MGAMVVVGCVPPDCSDAKIESSNGGTWATADLGSAPSSTEFHAVGFDGARFAAGGAILGAKEGSPTNAVALVSEDGRDWDIAPAQASLRDRSINDVVGRPAGGFLAVGVRVDESAFSGIVVWSSSDGLTWRTVYAGPSGDDVTADGLAVAPDDRSVAWGTDCPGVCGLSNVVMWSSDDGTSWRRVPIQPAFKLAGIAGAVAFNGSWLATGTISDANANSTGATWRSADGRTWTRAKLPKSAGYSMVDVVVAAGRAIAIGTREGDTTTTSVWDSIDGIAWTGPIRVPIRDAAYVAIADDGGVPEISGLPIGGNDTSVLRGNGP